MKKRPITSLISERILWGSILLWVALVFGHYFSLKSVFDFSFLSVLGSAFSQMDGRKFLANAGGSLRVLFCASAAGLVLWRIGRRVLGWMGSEGTGAVLRFCLEMAMGILFLNAFWLGLGLNGLWFDPLLWAIALLLLGWALWDSYRGFMKIRKFPRLPLPGRFFVALGLLGFLFLALALFQGFVPDVYFDALVYHLSVLQFWKFHHGIVDFYTNLYSYFPFSGELYFMNGFFFSGSEAAKMLNAFSAGLCGLAAAGWVGEETGWDRGWLAWAMVLSFPLVSATVWTTQNDVLLAFFFILFFYALVRWAGDKEGEGWACVAGLLGGAALTIKYTAGVGIAMGIIALAFNRKGLFSPQKRGGWTVLFSFLLLSLAPWALKNLTFTGNALYPYFSSWLGGRAFPAESMSALMGDHQAAFSGSFSLGGWIAQILGTDMDKTIAPLLFGFVPFLFLGGKWKPVTRYLAVLSCLLLLSGFLISHQLRLMIPAFVVSFIAMALVLGDTEKKRATYVWGSIVLLFGILSFLSLARISTNYYQSQKVWFGVETREEYLVHSPLTASYYGLTQAVGTLLKPVEQVLVVGDARGLYYPRPFLTNSVFDEQVLPELVRESKDADEIRKRLHEMGIDVLAISGDEMLRVFHQHPFQFEVGQDSPEKLREFDMRWTDPLYFDESKSLFRLRTSPRIDSGQG